jgi:1-acyl-sn-glycerol-3-phosphate acyltransferase
MKTISRVGVWGCCWVAGLAISVQGAEFILKPIRADGSYTIVGNEIRLSAG